MHNKKFCELFNQHFQRRCVTLRKATHSVTCLWFFTSPSSNMLQLLQVPRRKKLTTAAS